MTDQTTPAFPQPTGINLFYSGMTLRDYFAAKAMQSLILAEHSKNELNEIQAVMAYEVADAMLKERIKQ